MYPVVCSYMLKQYFVKCYTIDVHTQVFSYLERQYDVSAGQHVY